MNIHKDTYRVVQVIPTVDDGSVLFVSQKKCVEMEKIMFWGVVEHLDYKKAWETMTVNMRPIIEDDSGYVLIENSSIVAVRVKGTKPQMEKKYSDKIQMIINKMEEIED